MTVGIRALSGWSGATATRAAPAAGPPSRMEAWASTAEFMPASVRAVSVAGSSAPLIGKLVPVNRCAEAAGPSTLVAICLPPATAADTPPAMFDLTSATTSGSPAGSTMVG